MTFNLARTLISHSSCGLPFYIRCTGALNQKGSMPVKYNYQFDELSSQLRYINTSNSNCKETTITQKIKKELSIFKTIDFSQLQSAPLPAIVYGFGGIVPFVFPSFSFMIDSFSPGLATAQLMYGATILAFVGGVRWGNALAKDDVSHDQIGKSVIPSLVAWSALLVPEPLGFLIVSLGLVGALYVDLTSSKYLPWFCAMRGALTGIAVTSLSITLFVSLFN